MTGTNISKLSLNRSDVSHPHRRGNKAVVVIVLVCLIPLGLLAFKFRDRLLPAPKVRVIQVTAIEAAPGASRQPADTVLFQAAGWIEPDPFVTKATALVNGVVKEVHVIEGQSVKKGQLLVTFIDDDLKLQKQRLLAKKKQTEARVQLAKSAQQVAESELDHLSTQVKTAESRVAELKYDYDALKAIETISPKREIERARLAMITQQVKVDEIKNRRTILEAVVKSRKADVTIAEGALGEVMADLDTVELSLSRTQVFAPTDGIIMRFKSYVGSKHMLSGDNKDSATIAELFQPDRLQVRVDVPLQDAAGLAIGQTTRIKVDILPDTHFEGKVTSLAGAADIQRNTLQAKVKVLNPEAVLRPEMLARVEFLSSGSTSPVTGGKPAGGQLTQFVDKRCLVNQTDKEAEIWVVDPVSQTLERRKVSLGTAQRDGWVAVNEGARPGERIVLSPDDTLKQGQRVEVD